MKVFLLLPLLIYCSCVKYSSKQTKEIKQSGLMRVIGSSQSLHEAQQKCCFSLEVEDKNKRKGYERMKRRYSSVRDYLVGRDIIPEGQALRSAKEEVRMNHNRKTWGFKRVVCFLTEQDKSASIEKVLRKLSVRQVTYKQVGELTQYDLMMKAFNDAKRKANEYLETIEYRIKRVREVTILNADPDMESKHKWLFNRGQSTDSDDQASSESDQIRKSTSTHQINYSESETQMKTVEVEVLFAIESLDDYVRDSSSSDQGESEDHRSHSHSDDSSQL